ncbi:NAD(P)H-hydrate dehydratase [Halopseudomonas sp. Lyrl_26]
MPMHPELPRLLYSAAATRELDARIIAAGTPGFELMRRAAVAVWRELRSRWPQARQLTVLCGGGNNAGDGYLIAQLAHLAGWRVRAVAVSPPERLVGDAALALAAARDAGVLIEAWPVALPEDGVLVDALLGTGLDRPVGEPFAGAIAAINGSGLPVVAVDLPSGLQADTGAVLGCAVRADLTVTFIAVKPGLLTGQGPDQAGQLRFAALVESTGQGVRPMLERLELGHQAGLAPRPRAAHKGMFGHLLLIGGNRGMGGAILLAAQAALRAGAGKVSVATRAEHLGAMLTRCPEVMAHGVADPAQLAPLLDQATAVVVGPGLGRDDWARGLLDSALQRGLPCILDADALNLLAGQSVMLGEATVITPHPAEAARLLGISTAQVQADRPWAVRELAERFGCTAVLKGVGSLVADAAGERLPGLCSHGNPGMATAGMGDVLSGLVGALLAQRMAAPEAARLAVLVHALAGDRAAREQGELGILASDLVEHIRYYLNLRNCR